jgi:pimeloyl-ACP methyl ester carboxylesterase
MVMMLAVVAALAAVGLGLAAFGRAAASSAERRNPPVGSFVEVGGSRIHHVDVPAPEGATLPPVVFIHGASSNLKDLLLPLRPRLEGRGRLIFYDRPGHGWSERAGGLEAQAAILARLLDELGIDRAILVGHSLGGAVAAAFALRFPSRAAGLVFVAPATHPWPGGRTSWYYRLAATPLIGRLFAATLVHPAGRLRMAAATAEVFSPNPVPPDYLSAASIELVLRPAAFRANAEDVESLFAFVSANAPHYPTIAVPTVVISGDSDTVVFEEVHALGLVRDIPGAELAWVRNLGHKPDWVAPDLVVAAIERVAGGAVNLDAVVASVEARIARDLEPQASGSDVATPELSPP